jgi:hypothetical protein
LQGGTGNDSEEEWIMYVQTAEPYTVPPNYVDTEMSISKLKNGKATGQDQILAELITGRKKAQEGHLCTHMGGTDCAS